VSACVLRCITCEAGGALGVTVAGLCAVHGEHLCRGPVSAAGGEGLAQRAHLDGVAQRRACTMQGTCKCVQGLCWSMSSARACEKRKHQATRNTLGEETCEPLQATAAGHVRKSCRQPVNKAQGQGEPVP